MHPPFINGTRRDRESFAGIGFGGGERAEVIRSGERDPITPWVRGLVFRRDEWTCQHCRAVPFARDPHRRSGALHVDHIAPWSAGGSDRTDNLRTLCGTCNMARSNYVTTSDRSSVPIVRICANCLCPDAPSVGPESSFTVYCACHSHEGWALPGWHIL